MGRVVTSAGWVKGAKVTASTPLFTPCSPPFPALSLWGSAGGARLLWGDRLVSLIFAQTLLSPSWQLIKLLEPSLESEHGRPVPGAPSGELHFPGSLRMGRHRRSHCSAQRSLGQRLGSPSQDGTAALQGWAAQDSIQLASAGSLAKEGADPAGSGHAPGAGAAAGAGPAQPFLLPLTPHSTAGTPGQYCHSLCQGPHLAPALLQHQCSLCTWLQLCWVASRTPHPALGLGGKYSFLPVSQGCSNASHCSPPTCEAAGGMCPNCDTGH